MDTSILLVADHFRVGHIPAATIPGFRASAASLPNFKRGTDSPSLRWSFCSDRNFPACIDWPAGELTHEAYIAGLDSEQLAPEPGSNGGLESQGIRASGT